LEPKLPPDKLTPRSWFGLKAAQSAIFAGVWLNVRRAVREISTNHSQERENKTMWKPTNSPATKPPATPEVKETTPMTSNTTPNMNTNDMTPVSAPRNASLNNMQEQATIGKSLVIKGEVTGSESLYIDGRVEGSINLPGNRVTIGRNGVVNANVTAREIVVIGKLKGNLAASDRVDIRNEGSLTGDVVAQRISIEDGAFFKGGIDIRKPNASDAKTPEKKDSVSVSNGKEVAVTA
jgi:cytoskeletal protein CcmA (bactofilin family)